MILNNLQIFNYIIFKISGYGRMIKERLKMTVYIGDVLILYIFCPILLGR